MTAVGSLGLTPALLKSSIPSMNPAILNGINNASISATRAPLFEALQPVTNLTTPCVLIQLNLSRL